MNPLRWEKRHQVALTLSALLGMLLGLVVGYNMPGQIYDLEAWMFSMHGAPPKAVSWGLLGVVFGGGLFYIARISIGPPIAPGSNKDRGPTTDKTSGQPPRPTKDGRAVAHIVPGLRELLAPIAFVVVFGLTYLPFWLFRRSVDIRGIAATIPFAADAESAALIVGGFAVISGVVAIVLARIAYNEVRGPHRAEVDRIARAALPVGHQWALAFLLAAGLLVLLASLSPR